MSLRLRHPLPGATPTSPFGWRAAIPGVIGPELHNGQDWAAPEGTPISAAHAGTVRYSGWDHQGGGGHVIHVGSARCTTIYAHMRAPSALRPGDHVTAGQIVGYVGSTGASTGPHLHFILIISGMAVDPVPYLEDTVTPQQLKQILDAIEDVPRRTLSHRMKRPDDPKESTTLRAMVVHAPRRHAEVRGWLARLIKKLSA